jgi:hypothetical protein
MLALVAACGGSTNDPPTIVAAPTVASCDSKASEINVRQSAYPPELAPKSLVDVYCDSKPPVLVAKSVMFCKSNYDGSEQKWIGVTVVLDKAVTASCELDLRIVPEGKR